MNKSEIYKDLHHGSTWLLLLFSFLTLGIYYVHYIANQTDKLNIYLNNKISNSLIISLILTTYITVISIAFNYFYEGSELFKEVENLFSFISYILLIIWGFKVRNRMNELMNYNKKNSEWFNGFWTFFLSPYYFNYKINCVNKEKVNIEE